MNSHEHLLTVIFFVLQYLPTINIFSPSPFSPLFFLLFSPSASLSPAPTLPGEGGAGSAADVRGGAEEARGGREEASGRDGPQAEAGGGGGEDEREAVLPGQWNRRRRRAAGRKERRGDERGGEEGLGDLGGKDERRDTKERLGIYEDQRLSRKGETGETMEGRVERERVEEQRESYYWRWCENDIHIIQALIPADYQCLSASVTADSMRNTSRSGCCELQALI